MMRTAIALLLRLTLYMPLEFLATIVAALGDFLTVIAEGLMRMAQAMKQFTSAPFVRDWEKRLTRMDEAHRRRVLRELQRELS